MKSSFAIRTLAVLALVVSGLGLSARRAVAESKEVEVFYTLSPPDPGNEKTKHDAPQVLATVIGAPNLPLEKFTLIDKSSKVPVELKAIDKKEFNQGKETLALAIVMNGWEVWIGNDKEVKEVHDGDSDLFPGVLIGLRAALDKVNFATAGPPGSVGTVIIYSDSVSERVKMGPLANITGTALGTQQDYYGTQGRDLKAGVTAGVTALHNSSASRKVLIVICDGSDTDVERAKAELPAQRDAAKTDKIQTFAIIYRGGGEPGVDVISFFTKNVQTVSSAESIASAVDAILGRMNDRQYLTFAGYDKKLKRGLAWDGKPHALVIRYDKDESPEQDVTLIPKWDVAPPSGFPWLVLIIVLVVLILMIVMAVKVFGGKPAPAPVPVAAPMMAAPEPPKPAGPMKTVMIGVGGDQDGFPVVGWIVALNGVNAYQTMKLRSGGTKIGTAPPSDIVVNDGFMSTDHCMIHCSPSGFTLIDGGSTNGCYVNDRKVAKQDLVDNDTLTLGKTSFKFKSIT